MAKKYTIMIIPDYTGKCRKLSIPAIAIKGFVGLSIVASLTLAFFINRHIVLSDEVVELEDLRNETKEQKIKILKIAEKVKKYDPIMERLAKFDSQLRAITSLEGDESGGSKYGVGGAIEKRYDLSSISDLSNSEGLTVLDKEMDRLKNNASIQEISFKELDKFFEDQTTLLSSTPSIWPTRGWVTSGYGYRKSPFTGKKEIHEGIDIATRFNADVLAPADGIVVRAGFDSSYGKLISVDHGYGVVTKYAHNADILVSVGDRVKRGQIIAKVGSTGRSTGPHLHYEVILNGVPVNPFRYILEQG